MGSWLGLIPKQHTGCQPAQEASSKDTDHSPLTWLIHWRFAQQEALHEGGLMLTEITFSSPRTWGRT